MMYYGDHHPGTGGWIVMTLLMLLFWGGLIFAGYALVRATIGHQHPRGDARQLLDERLARGDIDAEDYARRRDLLDESARPQGRIRS